MGRSSLSNIAVTLEIVLRIGLFKTIVSSFFSRPDSLINLFLSQFNDASVDFVTPISVKYLNICKQYW